MMSNPDLMRQMILSNPQMQQLMEVHTDTKPDLTPQTNSLLTYFLPHLECNIYILAKILVGFSSRVHVQYV